MKIVFASSECTPYASTGGLADVAAALPSALARAGHQVTRILPMFRPVLEQNGDLHNLGVELTLPMSYRVLLGEVWGKEEEPGLRTLFIRRDEYYDRSYLYGRADRDYDDNVLRFVFFQKAVVALIDVLQLEPDIVHVNDWQTGLIPMYLKHGFQGTGRHHQEKTVFTIHNLAYQGIFPGPDLSVTGLPFSCFTMDTMEFYGNMSFIKAGITSADRVTTVSPSYAEEIRTEEFGAGLHGVLESRADVLQGILNGVDLATWNPAQDAYLADTFDAQRLAGKKTCKKALAQELELNLDGDPPVIGMISRLVSQKGFDLVTEVIESLMKKDLRLAVLGTGESLIEDAFRVWARQWPGRVGAVIDFDRGLSHRIEGGSDFFLMPSHFEPCGLNQMYSLRYGTLPIVHAVGGLKDTVHDLRRDPEHGTGFAYAPNAPEPLLQAVDDALTLYRDKSKLRKVRQRAMQQDVSWDRSAAAYSQLYTDLLS